MEYLELELEKLEIYTKLLEEKKPLLLVGQVNYITEAEVSVEIIVTTLEDYNELPVIMSFKEEVGRAKLPVGDDDADAVEKMKQFEMKVREKKESLKKKLEGKGFDVEYGIWKIL
jgi:hypothetical protein